jgi:hypothetical protein
MLTAGAVSNNTAAAQVNVGLGVDGVDQGVNVGFGGTAYPANMKFPCSLTWEITPTPGSHIIRPQFSVSAGTGTIVGAGGFATVFQVDEVVRQNTPNNTVTTG